MSGVQRRPGTHSSGAGFVVLRRSVILGLLLLMLRMFVGLVLMVLMVLLLLGLLRMLVELVLLMVPLPFRKEVHSLEGFQLLHDYTSFHWAVTIHLKCCRPLISFNFYL